MPDSEAKDEQAELEELAKAIRAYNDTIVEEFRANGGKCGGGWEGNPMLLLTHTGAKSGTERTNPLTCYATNNEHDDYIVMASQGGAPTHPQWYFNVRANPDVIVEVGTDRYEAKATELGEAEREELFKAMVEALPRFGDYQANTERVIPVIRLRRSAG